MCFVEDLTSVPDEISASVFEDAQKKVSHLIAENCLASPKEYWNFFSICWTAVAGLRASSKACKSVVSLLENVGQLMVEKVSPAWSFVLLNFTSNRTPPFVAFRISTFHSPYLPTLACQKCSTCSKTSPAGRTLRGQT